MLMQVNQLIQFKYTLFDEKLLQKNSKKMFLPSFLVFSK